MDKFFMGNNLVLPGQSRFKTGDPYINQLLSITHEIYKALDDSYGVVFLDICKALEKV